jgi:DNA-binding GntR family transcriptional regulator
MARKRVAADSFEGLVPVDRPGPLRHRVQETLRELIIARALPPGQHLVESELADRLDVSRGPVREALQALHSQGWVQLRPGRGAFVHEPSADEVDQVFAVRAALESEAAGLAAERIGAEDLAELRDICAGGRAAVAAGDSGEVVAANSALHRRIARLSGVDLLCGYIESLDLRVRWFYLPVARTRGLDSWDEHDQLLGALDAHDRDRAAALMRWHTEQTRQAYREMVTGARAHSQAGGA